MHPDSQAADHQDPGRYVRFVVLFHARTGSTLLAHALNSHPHVICFGELFNWLHSRSYVDFSAEGYDNRGTSDVNLRDTEPIAFLQSRVYCAPSPITSAVGFKLGYVHCDPPWGFTAVLDYLVQDKGIRVLHVQRRNMLKSLASEKRAAVAGDYVRLRTLPPLSSIPKAFIHPAKAFERAKAIIAQSLRRVRTPTRIWLSMEECRAYFDETKSAVARHEELFREHDKLSVFYEEMLSSRDEVFARAQSFLGVEPQTLAVGLSKQNPDDLRALIENYDQLREAFAGTEYSEFFL